jgi:RNA polymerase subunit RPABC4/transcription elongation factor Spt4
MQSVTLLNQRRFNIVLFSSVIIVALGVVIVTTMNLYPTVTIHHLSVEVTNTDWYNSGTFSAERGDWFSINVQVSGGSGKLVVRRTDGSDIFGEIQSSSLVYDVNVNDADTYFVQIWTRSWPFPSDYIDLSGTIDLNRVVFSPFGYLAIGLIAMGSTGIVGSILLRRHQTIQARKLELEFRDCPSCAKRVSITERICPYCGHNILAYTKCRNCGNIYDRAKAKCPNCGAPNK